MKTITAADASRRLFALLRRVAQGETFTVTSHGRAVATIATIPRPLSQLRIQRASKRGNG